MEKVEFTTHDGVKIIGDYVDAGVTSPQVLLLHMMPSTRQSWGGFAQKLKDAGYSSLAIDLRGHGESVYKNGTRIDYQQFSDGEHQETRGDVDAALAWLQEEKNGTLTRIAVVGASIGANLAVDALVRYPALPAAALFSPGLDYRGVLTLPAVGSLRTGQSLFLAASNDDSYSLETIRALYDAAHVAKDKRELRNAGHGTTMCEREPAIMEDITNWLKIYLQ